MTYIPKEVIRKEKTVVYVKEKSKFVYAFFIVQAIINIFFFCLLIK